MEPETSSPYPQGPATCPYPEPTPSSPHDPLQLPVSSHLRLGLPNGLFPSGFPTNTLCTPLSSPIRATLPAHLIRLDFTTRTILGKIILHTTNFSLNLTLLFKGLKYTIRKYQDRSHSFLKYVNKWMNFYRCTVHSDICRVHSPTNALLLI